MKLIEQYLTAIGAKLPWKGRADIIAELRSLLEDGIEQRFGKQPTDNEVKTFITEFGSPSAVATRYTGDRPVIAAGLAALFRLLVLILLGAMGISFFIVMIMNLITVHAGSITGMIILAELAGFAGRTFGAWISATGFMTIGFMIASRFLPDAGIDLDEDWNTDELSDIEPESDAVSIPEAVLGLAGLAAVFIMVNFFPGVFTAAEDLFEKTGLVLGHRLNMELFAAYIPALSLLWLAEIGMYGTLLGRGRWNGVTRVWQLITEVAGAGLLLVIAADGRLFAPFCCITGWRIIFLIVGIVGVAESAGLVWKLVKKHLLEKRM